MTVQQLELFGVQVRVDRENRTVVAEGEGVDNWGQRQRLEHQLERARLAYVTHATYPGFRIVVHPG
jgi:hypothetical protein